ncbi:alpha-factor pheromone receptor [Starmerella bacillaris]|uniref:Alpha-factor pheromone receptor n=1 Tax=Starmerella bacillaris TaxID=1247836 RepID=A0AAV5RG60_STABA|nr:alpha-factor pheromone receptor [Starmerella bacillaris]
MSSPFAGYSPDELKSLDCYLYYDSLGSDWTYPLGSLDDMMQARVIEAIHCGVRIGSAVVVSGLLFFVARSYKSTLFCMYQTNFLLMIISSALQLAYLLGFGASLTIFMTAGTMPVNNQNVSIASSVFQTILVMSLLGTLVCQIYVACGDQNRKIRYTVTAIAAVGCFPTYFIWLWRVVLVGIQNIDSTWNDLTWNSDITSGRWVFLGAWSAFAASTSFCSFILCAKLWIVNHKRASLGIQKFDPIKMLLTMAIQNSVIPAILAIISAAMSPNNFGAKSISASTIPITAVLLPMGYIWAQRHNSPPPSSSIFPHSPSDEKYATGSDSVKEYYLKTENTSP